MEVIKMAEEVKELTLPEWQAKLKAAMAKQDMKAVMEAARAIDKAEKAKEAAERETKLKALETITEEVKVAIQKAIKPFYDGGKLDVADGVWFSQDFGEKIITCKLTKGATRKSGGGGGAGKKFDVTTDNLLEKYGNQEYKDGQTFKAAYEADADKNKRFAIRKALLKKDGQIK